MANKFRLNGYRLKRALLLLVLISILFFVLWQVMQKVSPIFKPPEESRSDLSLDESRYFQIEMQVDLKEAKKAQQDGPSLSSLPSTQGPLANINNSPKQTNAIDAMDQQ